MMLSKGEKSNNAINRRSRLCLKGHRLQHRLRGYGIIPLIRMGSNKSPPALQRQGRHLSVSAGGLLSGSPLAAQTGACFGDGPTGALLWEAGVHPAVGPPSGTVTIEAVFPLRLQAFPK